MQAITSVFTATELKTGKSFREFINGAGQEAVQALRTLYPRLTIFVLEGHEVNGDFIPLDVRK